MFKIPGFNSAAEDCENLMLFGMALEGRVAKYKDEKTLTIVGPAFSNMNIYPH